MVRISTGNSGTAYGTVVLHVAPEAAVGGPLAFVQTGDMVDLDVPKRGCAEFPIRSSPEKETWKVPEPPARLVSTFLTTFCRQGNLWISISGWQSGATVPRDNH